jgi:hypothetical protein
MGIFLANGLDAPPARQEFKDKFDANSCSFDARFAAQDFGIALDSIEHGKTSN